jgi:DNA-binding transcriptional regulator YhcF (GntR family)
MSAPASARIAAELRTRIASGDLPPGARMPSTRALVQRHGIAMATATKILTTLRHEGLIRSIPGVGTVVAGPAHPPVTERAAPVRRRSAADGTLTSERIVTAGIAVADTEGLAGLSMRRVATELAVAPMSLYRHVGDKDDLLLRMMDATIGEVRLPEPPARWREALGLAARALWATFRRHPWMAPALSLTRPQVLPNALEYSEWVLTALRPLGLDPVATFTVHLTLFTFVRGTAINLELEAEAAAASGQSSDEWMAQTEPDLLALVSTGSFPAFEQALTSGFDFDLDALFEFGLQRLLDGIQALDTQ